MKDIDSAAWGACAHWLQSVPPRRRYYPLAVHARLERVISACGDGFVRFWNAGTGKLRWYYAIDKDLQQALAMSRDGRRLAVLTAYKYTVLTTDSGKALAEHGCPKGKKVLAPGFGGMNLSPKDRKCLSRRVVWTLLAAWARTSISPEASLLFARVFRPGKHAP